MNHAERVKDGIERVEAMAEQWSADFDAQFPGEPYGLNSLTDEEHAVWYEQQMAKYPPLEAFRYTPKDLAPGAVNPNPIIMGNAWILMLSHTENGEAETKRYLKTRAKGEVL